MHLLTWVIIIAILFVLGLVLKRTPLAQQAQVEQPDGSEAASPMAQLGLARFTNNVRGRVQALRNGLVGTAQDPMVTQFRAWAPQAFAKHPAIQQWLAALTDEQIAALTDHLSKFCHDMGFELTWLLETRVSPTPSLLEGLTDIVRLYSRASYQAVHLQEEVEIFRIYYDFLQNPKSRANRELGEHLFGKLMEQGKSPVKISEHLAASARKRQAQILNTIQQIVAEDPQTFSTTLKSVLLERAMAHDNGQAISTNNTANGTVRTSTAKAGAA
ncbi:MAG: hypothetical protein R2932_29215 [Caldilineaceae bacterium]